MTSIEINVEPASNKQSDIAPFKQLPVSQIRQDNDVELQNIEKYCQAAHFLSAAQIYLKANYFLWRSLTGDDIKDRLLGHWGTCPVINLVWAHFNRLIRHHSLHSFIIVGPGHGAPAALANLFLEGSLSEKYPTYPWNRTGAGRLIHAFSWPGGFPSHINAETPGAIHEGGELGYALSVAFGAVLDHPDLIVPVIVGDGEMETAATATGWQCIKFLDPKESGAVLPIVNLNGYKISNPTIFGSMSNDELWHMFRGYGYNPILVEGTNYKETDLHAALWAAMDEAFHTIRKIQHAARREGSTAMERPPWPVILLRTPKGMTGIQAFQGKRIEGHARAHQVPLKEAKENDDGRKCVEDWMRSYNPESIFNRDGSLAQHILDVCPSKELRMGSNPIGNGRERMTLRFPSLSDYKVEMDINKRGGTFAKNTGIMSEYLGRLLRDNRKRFRVFSPDELESNQLQGVLEATHRTFTWPLPADEDARCGSGPGGQLIEMLSEHTLQALLQGYLLTGRSGIFPSYEAFLGIVATMMDQYAKFLQLAKKTPFRGPTPSLTYLETSTLWRQEHNGFSHQNPGFINTLLNKKPSMLRVYLPPDANTSTVTLDHCVRGVNHVNLIITSKHPSPQWLPMEEAITHCRSGASVWRWASTFNGKNPDVVLVGIGPETTLEVMAAACMLRRDVPDLRVRVVNVTDLMILAADGEHPHGLSQHMFDALFTHNRPVIINFHGYPSAVHQLLFDRPNANCRFIVNGYIEEGTTTTPFNMMVLNKCSRYHIAIQAIEQSAQHNHNVAPIAVEKERKYEYELRSHKEYIEQHGKDPQGVTDFEFNWIKCFDEC